MRLRGLTAVPMLICLAGAGSSQEPSRLTPPQTTPAVVGDVRMPRSPGPHPAVILLHGSSGWRPEYVDMSRRFADAGFAALVLDYYAETGGAPIGSNEKLQKWPAWRQAVRDAYRFLRNAPSVDGERIALVGFSRGAFLAVSIAAELPSVRAVVDFYGGGGGGTLAIEEEVRGLPPVLILHGERDSVVPVSYALALRAAVLEAGGSVEMRLLPGVGHAFNLPWAETYSPAAADQAWSAVLTFLRSHLDARDERPPG